MTSYITACVTRVISLQTIQVIKVKMPYNNLDNLPDNVKNVLPRHAQEIYKASFNNAYQEYQNKNKRHVPTENIEVTCHKVAWATVKNKYHKNNYGQWLIK